MMQRIFAIVLVPFFVVGNSFAHSHSTATQSSPTHGRAHFHFGSGSHHGHHHHESHGHHGSHEHSHDGDGYETDDSKSALTAPVDHDSDAIYLAAVDFLFSTAEHGSMDLGSHAVVAFAEDSLPAIRPPVWCDLQRNSLTSELPLYLLHAALRL